MVSETRKPLSPAQRGAIGARRKWANHTPRTVRLDGLTPEQARLVRALIEAAKDTTEGIQ